MEIVMIINERILMKELENLSTADQDIARVSVRKISEAKTHVIIIIKYNIYIAP